MKNDAIRRVPAFAALPLQRGTVVTIGEDGRLGLRLGDGRLICTREYVSLALTEPFDVGDELLLGEIADSESVDWVVLGRLSFVGSEVVPKHLTVKATEALTLECGHATLDLRADGKVMIKGEDVLLRAKGTQRIRAGNVAIN